MHPNSGGIVEFSCEAHLLWGLRPVCGAPVNVNWNRVNKLIFLCTDPLPNVPIVELCAHKRSGEIPGLARNPVPSRVRDVDHTERQVLGYGPGDIFKVQFSKSSYRYINVLYFTSRFGLCTILSQTSYSVYILHSISIVGNYSYLHSHTN